MEENKLDYIREIVGKALDAGASDIHLVPGNHVMFRIDGKLIQASEETLGAKEVWQMMEGMLDEAQRDALKGAGAVKTGYTFEGIARVRVSVFRQSGICGMVLRLHSLQVPEPKELGIPESVIALILKRKGLVLVAGESGSGKTTTLASLASLIAKNYARSILLIENPAEYRYSCGSGEVIQRETGADCSSTAEALGFALYQDPDVIVVGELNDAETISLAVTAAETGHLVFGALHADSAASAVSLMADAFPPEVRQSFRERLASVLAGVAVQQLLPKQSARGRAAAFEVLIANPAVCSQIREGSLSQLSNLVMSGEKDGMQAMDDAIYELYMKSCISAGTAVSYAHDTAEMRRKLKLFKI